MMDLGTLKTNAVVILLRTIDQANGMCNGTRLVIQDIRSKVINTKLYYTWSITTVKDNVSLA